MTFIIINIINDNNNTFNHIHKNINKKIVLAPEMQGDCKLEQTDWQLIVEGGVKILLLKNLKMPKVNIGKFQCLWQAISLLNIKIQVSKCQEEQLFGIFGKK